MELRAMVYSDQLIIQAIQKLSAEKAPLTATAISDASGVAFSTVKRRLDFLERGGLISRQRVGRRWGSYIEISSDDLAAAGV